MKLHSTLALAILSTATLAHAAITSQKDSGDFTYRYEMDVNPSSQDLDANTTSDFFAGTASGITSPQTYSGGLANSNQGSNQVLFRTDIGGSITRNTLSANTPYTLEATVAKTSGTQGSQGWFALALQSPGATQSARFSFKDDRVTFRTTGGTFTEFLVGTDFTTGSHTVRIAYEGTNNYYVWVNDILLNADLSTPINGGNGSFNASGAWFIGDFSGDTAGDWQVDYLRFDNTGAYEPGTTPTGNDLTWTAATDGNWDTLTNNWKLPDTTPTAFADADDVTFDDTAPSGLVTIVGTLSPASILVNNDTLPYTLGGAALAGPAVLTKDGPGALTLTADHDYTGGTTLTAGTLTAGDGATAGQLGRGAVSLAAGTTLTISRSDFLDYKTTPKLRDVSGEGDLVLDGGGTVFNYTGGGTDFAAANTWSGFSGDLLIRNGSEFQTIRNGATSMGTGTVVLGDATTSGFLSQIEGNWTWTNPISVVGPDNAIINRSAGPPRSLKLQGVLSGDGGLTLTDATFGMNDANRGFVITTTLALTAPLNIDFDVPVRIGGVPGNVGVNAPGLNADSFGSLGSTDVTNEGILTFSRTDAHTLSTTISGGGRVRIGIPSTANLGDTSTQVVTLGLSQPYTGNTTVEAGTLVVPTGLSLASALTIVETEGTLSGGGTLPNALDIYGTVAPGASAGTLAVGGIVGLLADSTYAWEINTWGGSTPGTTHDLLTAGSFDLLGTLANPVVIAIAPDSTAGLTGFAESNQTYTIATAATPISGFAADGFVVDDSAFVTATGSAGSWAVQLSGDSLSLQLAYTLGVPDAYANWIDGFFMGETNPAIIGFDADPDGDGVQNGVENFLGTSPDAFNPGLTVTASTPTSVTATHSQSNDPASDVTGGYQWSTDLTTWNPSGATDGNGVTATISTVVTDDQAAPANDTVEVTATITAGPSAKLFLRVIATQDL